MKVVVVSASLSESSTTSTLGRKLAQATVNAATNATFSIIELRHAAVAVTNAVLTGFPSPELEAVFDDVAQADAIIAVTPAYNASYSGLFKLFFDVLPEDTLKGKPVAIGVTGGTPRHSLVTEHAVRPLFSYLHAVVAPTAVYAATEDFGVAAYDSDGHDGSALERRINRTGQELAKLADIADNSAKPQATKSDDTDDATSLFADFAPFDQM
ncbi:FMN reductase [Arcanobacterium phocae]|uniref:FMN reductase n=1 Tax=Arcanobacterium phocae TaxID=131112 RepID=A0A1H2LKF0_9ACTO|nr:CE1759 family FMN reductase [Arcanobacterium phocae]SDU81487.1 FMN reductase [Arcanobacterium phocae]